MDKALRRKPWSWWMLVVEQSCRNNNRYTPHQPAGRPRAAGGAFETCVLAGIVQRPQAGLKQVVAAQQGVTCGRPRPVGGLLALARRKRKMQQHCIGHRERSLRG